MNLKEYLDDKTIEQFKQGDQFAFEKIYNNFHVHVYRMAYQFFKNEDKAKDIVQDTFMLVYKYRKNLKNNNGICNWIQKITYTNCVAQYRKNKNDSFGHLYDLEEFLPETYEDEKKYKAVDLVQLKEANDAVIEIIEKLQPAWRTVAYLRFFEELSIKEIAEITNSTTGTVGSQIQRIKNILKKELNDRGYTKETCLSVILLPNLVGTYQSFVNSNINISEESSQVLFENLKKDTVQKKKNTPTPYVVLALSILTSIGVMSLKNGDIQIFSNNSKLSAIAEVQYNGEFTNQPIKISVKTTNDNYDEVLMNKSDSLVVDKNGKYLIELMKDKTVIDSKEIDISNLDRDIPIVIKEIYDGNKVELTLQDLESGIDFSGIELYANDEKSENLTINEEHAVIYIQKVPNTNFILKVPDNVGNVLQVNINFYDKSEK